MKKTLIAAAVVALSAPFASAQVVSESDAVFGIGSITRDVQQDLHFLDLTLSTGRSYNDVSTQFGPGGDFEGWRHATTQEVANLVNNWGFSPTVSATDTPLLGNTGADQLSGLVSLLTPTFTTGTPVTSRISYGVTNDTAGSPNLRIVSELRDFIDPLVNDSAGPSYLAYPVENINSGIGHFLVREAPAPSALALFGVGALAATRRRR